MAVADLPGPKPRVFTVPKLDLTLLIQKDIFQRWLSVFECAFGAKNTFFLVLDLLR